MVAFDPKKIKSRFKHVFTIDDPKINTRVGFHKTMRFIRKAATRLGDKVDFEKDVIEEFGKGGIGDNTFECIKYMEVDDDDPDPLLQIGIASEGKLVCLFILKEDLYVIGYSLPIYNVGFYIANDKHSIIDFGELDVKLSYGDGPQKPIGVGAIVNAVNQLHSYTPDLGEHNASTESIKESLETMFINIAEAARFRSIENQVGMTMKTLEGDNFSDDDDADPAQKLSYEKEHIRINEVVTLPVHGQALFKNFSHLSKLWIKYVISDGKVWSPSAELQHQCQITTPAALRNVLAIVKPDITEIREFFNNKHGGKQGAKKVDTFFKLEKTKGGFKKVGRKKR